MAAAPQQAPRRGLRLFGEVLRARHVRPLLGASIVGRFALATWSLGLVLFVEERTGSFATAGAVSAIAVLGAAVGAPVVSRLADRRGPTPVLLGCAALTLVMAVTLVGLGLAGAPAWLLTLPAFAANFAFPPLSGALRALWPTLLARTEDLRTALTVDAMAIEAVFVGGPLMAAAVLAVASPAALLLVTAACTASGAIAFATRPPVRGRRGLPATTLGAGPLAYPGLRTLLVQTLCFGGCIGALEVALPAFAQAEATPGAAPLGFAAQAVGSACGGLVYGARAGGRDVRRLYLTLALLLPPSLALIAVADSVASLLCFAALSGCLIAPYSAALNELTGELVPTGMLTETFGWTSTAVIIGVAAGNAGAGALVEASGWRAAVLVPCAVALTAVGVVVLRRETLRPLAAETA